MSEIEKNCKKKIGRPTLEKKDKRFEIRLTSDTYLTLEECAYKLGVSKAEVIHKGIDMVKNTLR